MATLLAFLLLCAFLAVDHTPLAMAETEDISTGTAKGSCLVSQVITQALQLKEQSHQLHSLQTKVAALENQLGNIKAIRKCTKSVAFSAKMNWRGNFNVGQRGTLKYTKIVTNIGGGYNSLTGHFTAPFKGTYAFYTSLRSTNNKSWIFVRIFKGSARLAEATGEGKGDHWDRGSIFVTTHMEKGEVAFVRQTGGGTYLDASDFTTFSGFLVACG